MPANIVKPGQEAKWRKAKRLAAEQGRAKDYAYVMGVYKKMVGKSEAAGTGSLIFDARVVSVDDIRKAEYPLHARVGGAPVHGQAALVIRELRAGQAAAGRKLAALTRKPEPWSLRRVVEEDGRAVKSASDVVDGLGLGRDARRAVEKAVDAQAKAPLGYAQNARAAIVEACKGAGVEPAARSVILRRSMKLWGAVDGRHLGKSEIGGRKSDLPDEGFHDGRARQVAQLRKAQDPGDLYFG